MNEELFTELSLQIGITGLIAYMGWIVYDLAKESKAGRYGTAVMFFALSVISITGSNAFLEKKRPAM